MPKGAFQAFLKGLRLSEQENTVWETGLEKDFVQYSESDARNQRNEIQRLRNGFNYTTILYFSGAQAGSTGVQVGTDGDEI